MCQIAVSCTCGRDVAGAGTTAFGTPLLCLLSMAFKEVCCLTGVRRGAVTSCQGSSSRAVGAAQPGRNGSWYP